MEEEYRGEAAFLFHWNPERKTRKERAKYPSHRSCVKMQYETNKIQYLFLSFFSDSLVHNIVFKFYTKAWLSYRWRLLFAEGIVNHIMKVFLIKNVQFFNMFLPISCFTRITVYENEDHGRRPYSPGIDAEYIFNCVLLH